MQSAIEPEDKRLRQHFGDYIGITPTDESGLAFGESDISIGPEGITWRIATGLELRTELIPFADLEEIPQTEIDEALEVRGGGYGLTIIGLKHKSPRSAFRAFLFKRTGLLPIPAQDIMLSIGMGDMLGPTMFVAKKRFIAAAIVRFLLNCAEIYSNGGLPRLGYGGVTRQRYLAGYSLQAERERFEEHFRKQEEEWLRSRLKGSA